MSDNLPPLAERMRPKSLAEFVGQEHLTGKGKLLHTAIKSKILPSLIFWGPPGVGKTTLALILSKELDVPFYSLSAISSGVKEVREVIKLAARQGKAILFIDEIHRFSKSQQDSLLGAVERGIVILIGATTENPSFEVISALLSRCQVYTLNSLGVKELSKIVNQALEKDVLLLKRKIKLKETDSLFLLSGGDGRKLLNLLELVTGTFQDDPLTITDEMVQKVAHQKIAQYDKNGEQHYDIISAFIKSIRGSDPNAALYYLARMIDGGEDPKFIARRLLILASEDIGNANPNALLLANNCFSAVNVIGYPECQLILSQTTIYLASSPKSNSSTTAISKALALVRETGNLPVPLHIRNAPTQLMKDLNYGKGYEYAHSFEGNFTDMEYLPDEVSGHRLYEPSDNASELKMRERLKQLWKEKYGY